MAEKTDRELLSSSTKLNMRPKKIVHASSSMTPIEKLEARFRRLAAQKREDYESTGHQKWAGMAYAYTIAAESVRKLRGELLAAAAGEGM